MKEYVITKMEKFCKAIITEAANGLSQKQNGNINDFITIEQCKQIVESQCDIAEDTGEYTINEKSYWNIITKVSEQIYQSALSKLAADDIIECAWDDDANKMIFWIEDQLHGEKKIYEKPL